MKQYKKKNREFLPPDNGDICWNIGSENFSRKEVFDMLYTQRAMIKNDVKRIYGICLENVREVEF